jgi:hypothetical protein
VCAVAMNDVQRARCSKVLAMCALLLRGLRRWRREVRAQQADWMLRDTRIHHLLELAGAEGDNASEAYLATRACYLYLYHTTHCERTIPPMHVELRLALTAPSVRCTPLSHLASAAQTITGGSGRAPSSTLCAQYGGVYCV